MRSTPLILGGFILGGSAFLMTQDLPFGAAFGFILIFLVLMWLLSLYLKDASIVDIFWGLGFALLAWFGFWQLGASGERSVILCLLVSLWGFRLATYIYRRNKGKGEDFRYQVWRKEGGKQYWWISFFRVFALQGLLMWVIASPLIFAQSETISWTWLDSLGLLLWTIGFSFEAIGDWQLARFKSNPGNTGKVMDKGLWRYTRHPNYFGDALLWWGYFCFALSLQDGWMYLFSPLLMSILLMKVSGVAMLEETLVESKPQYREYIQKTSAFFPWFPKT